MPTAPSTLRVYQFRHDRIFSQSFRPKRMALPCSKTLCDGQAAFVRTVMQLPEPALLILLGTYLAGY